MGIRKWVLPLLGALILTACGREAPTPEVTGYNNEGQQVTMAALSQSEACADVATPFTQGCLNAGFEIVYAQSCQLLCSGNATN